MGIAHFCHIAHYFEASVSDSLPDNFHAAVSLFIFPTNS